MENCSHLTKLQFLMQNVWGFVNACNMEECGQKCQNNLQANGKMQWETSDESGYEPM